MTYNAIYHDSQYCLISILCFSILYKFIELLQGTSYMSRYKMKGRGSRRVMPVANEALLFTWLMHYPSNHGLCLSKLVSPNCDWEPL